MVPTQKQLAQLAGVSSGTVSNVVNDVAGVSESARRKVLAAIEQLNYRPNLIARSLRTNRTRTIGIVVPDITIPIYPQIIRGAEAATRTAGYFLIVLDSEDDHQREERMLELLHAQRVEGTLLVAAGGHKWTAESAQALTGNTPLVCLDRYPQGLVADSVCVDDPRAAELAVAHLAQMGHRNIAVITGPLTLRNEHDRLRGYRRAMARCGLPVREELIWSGDFSNSTITALCQNGMLSNRLRPSALLATNGVTGLSALKCLYAMGLQTPRDIAFVTIDEITREEFFRPGITSVVQPAQEIGSRAVQMLLRRIEEGTPTASPEKIRLTASLVVRESSSTPYASQSRAPRRSKAS